jgi:DNA mismatch endonuclease, patch repair protein
MLFVSILSNSLVMDRLSQERRSFLMSRVRSKNTTPEMRIRRMVFAMGFRYRIHDAKLPGRPDLVFSGRRKVLFVNGCFWHGHAKCRYGKLPKTRKAFWSAKILRNRERDRQAVAALRKSGWKVLTVWQCEIKKALLLEKKIYEFLIGS